VLDRSLDQVVEQGQLLGLERPQDTDAPSPAAHRLEAGRRLGSATVVST
jgi:hypothetical protein